MIAVRREGDAGALPLDQARRDFVRGTVASILREYAGYDEPRPDLLDQPIHVVEPGDDLHDLSQYGLDEGLDSVALDGCVFNHDARGWLVFTAFSNDCGPSWFIPADPWLDAEVKANLIAQQEQRA